MAGIYPGKIFFVQHEGLLNKNQDSGDADGTTMNGNSNDIQLHPFLSVH
jgi:hypothetical protein